MKNSDKLLPIGTIVRLNKAEKNIMIIGRMVYMKPEGKDTIHYTQYGACLHPEGIISQDTIFFNNEDIEEVIIRGHILDQSHENQLLVKMNEIVEKEKIPLFKISKEIDKGNLS